MYWDDGDAGGRIYQCASSNATGWQCEDVCDGEVVGFVEIHVRFAPELSPAVATLLRLAIFMNDGAKGVVEPLSCLLAWVPQAQCLWDLDGDSSGGALKL